MSLQLAGSPVTPAIVHLLTNSFVTLTDATGLISLIVQAASRLLWPDLFGIIAQQNAVHPANFDLLVVYNPLGGAPGMSAPPVLETLADLSLTSGDPNFVVNKVSCAFPIHQGAVAPARSGSRRVSRGSDPALQ